MRNKKIILISACFILISFFIAPFSLAAEKTKLYLATVSYDQGSIYIENVTVKEGYLLQQEKKIKDQGYIIKLIGFSEEVLEEVNFAINREISPRPPLEGEEELGMIILEEAKQLVTVPYHNNGRLLQVYAKDSDEMLAEKNISALAQMCGDSVCQEQENFSSCPEDCGATAVDGYCNQAQFSQDSDCGAQMNENENSIENKIQEDSLSMIWKIIIISAILLICVIIITVVIIKKRKNNNV